MCRTKSVGLLVAILVSGPASGSASERSLKIQLQQINPKLGPPAVAFGLRGELYVAHRRPEEQRRSSAIVVQAFDGATGRELRHAEIRTPTIDLPQGPQMFTASPDGGLLLFAEAPSPIGPDNDAYAVVVDSTSLVKITDDRLQKLALARPWFFGFSEDSRSILVGSSETRRPAGGRGPDMTASVRVLELDARNLENVLKDRTAVNTLEGLEYSVDSAGAPWFSKWPLPRSFSRYDWQQRKLAQEVATSSAFGITAILFLKSGIASFTDEPTTSGSGNVGEVSWFDLGSNKAARTKRMTDCGFRAGGSVSSGQSVFAAECRSMSQAESNAGAITVSKAVIFEAGSLRVLGAVPLSKSFHRTAVWDSADQVRLAVGEADDIVRVYLLPRAAKPPNPAGMARR